MADTRPAHGLAVHGAPEGFDALLLARRRAETDAPVLHVCRDDARMARVAEALGFFAPDVEVLRFPAWDCLPYDRVSPNAEIVAERVATLTRLLEPGARPRVLITTVNALVQKVPPRENFAGSTMELKRGGRVQPERLAAFLEANGYNRTGTVMEPGEYALRGGIVDLFPAGEPDPVRLDLFGDEIEGMRRFDTGTQRSGAALDRLSLRPVGEVFLDAESISRFRTAWRELFGAAAAEDPLYVSVSAGRRHPGVEHWAGLFHERMETLLDYLPGASVSLDYQAEDVLAARLEMIADHYEARRAPVRVHEGEVPYRPAPPGSLYLDRRGWERMLSRGPLLRFLPFARPDGAEGIEAGGRPGRLFAEARASGQNVFVAFAEHAAAMAKAGRKAGGRRLDPRLARADRQSAAREPGGDRDRGGRGGAARRAGGRGGACGAGPGARLRGAGGGDGRGLRPLGGRRAGPARRAHRAAAAPAPQRVPVHRRRDRHRAGRPGGPPGPRHRRATTGIETISVGDAPHDCLRLLYDGGDKLFLPGREHRGAVALRQRGGRASRSTSWAARAGRTARRGRSSASRTWRRSSSASPPSAR